MKPRIFVSSVSRELRTARQLVSNTLLALGYEPVWQDIFDTSSDDIRPMLRKQIDSCSAVLQIIGDTYGAEPPKSDATFGRVSYTQYEALYAKSCGKRVYYLIAQHGFPRDATAEAVDVPHDESTSALADVAERRRLQTVYREQVLAAEQVYYPINSQSETELSVRRLRDDLAKLRRGFKAWMVSISALLVLVAGGIVWQTRELWKHWGKLEETQQAVAKQTGAIDETKQSIVKQTEALEKVTASLDNPDRLREQLKRPVLDHFQRALDSANLEPDWRRREELRKAAAEDRDRSLARVEEYFQWIKETIESGAAPPEYIELNRILTEQGADEALNFIKSHEERDFHAAENLLEKARSEARLRLAVQMEGVILKRNQGDYQASRILADRLLGIDSNWPQVLDNQFWNLTELADRAMRYETITVAETLYLSADSLAQRLAQGAEPHPQAQRNLSISQNKLGNVLLLVGQSQQAMAHYEQSYKIREKLAAINPDDVLTQRDLSMAHTKLGDVLRQMGQPQQALAHYENSLKICVIQEQKDSENAECQRDLADAHDGIGDLLLQMGQPELALPHFADAGKIRDKLVQLDPTNIEALRDRAISHAKDGIAAEQMGLPAAPLSVDYDEFGIPKQLTQADPSDVQAQRSLLLAYQALSEPLLEIGRSDDAQTYLEESLKIGEKLAAADPSDTWVQRDLLDSYWKLGDLLLQEGQRQPALTHYEEGLKLANKLAVANPLNAQAQRDMSIAHYKLGNVMWQIGQAQAALTHYQEDLRISEKIASADTRNAQAQTDLVYSLRKMGRINRDLGSFELAMESLQAGIAVLDRMIASDQNVDESKTEKEKLVREIETCEIATIATGDWDELLTLPADRLPFMLARRCTYMAKMARRADVEQSAEKLLSLAPQIKEYHFDSASQKIFYDAACGFGLCLKLSSGWNGTSHFPSDNNPAVETAEIQEMQNKYRQKAVYALKLAVAAGFKESLDMTQDPDLLALHSDPEFREIYGD